LFSNIGTTEIIIIAIVLILLFGARKIVDLARGLGESKKELKKAAREFKNDPSDPEESSD